MKGALGKCNDSHQHPSRRLRSSWSPHNKHSSANWSRCSRSFGLTTKPCEVFRQRQRSLKVTAERDGLLAEVAACEQKMGANESLLGQMEAVSKKLEEKDHQLRAITALIGDGSGVYDQRMEVSNQGVIIHSLPQ